ncbi:glycosyltransferase family 2 protein [Oscillatoria sp. CS-180]|uniref:glycosyltransferase family 2 protein n=1 Tax=Oscillatoria sp. CS-180 TaxID=3021720 RepID=UPI00232CD0E4|nr:glycosyltransferase family 2 protein [Oscillatoria sp. CS-180]MDB9525374.1 glycosyltransferase family 2 protein [Oscillatoria sp. CS-180]
MSELLNTQPFRVGIVLATYNCDRVHFEQQIVSIQNQDFANWSCLVLDDGSSETIRRHIVEIIGNDDRFIYRAQSKNLGAYHNFESGLVYFSQDPTVTHLAFSDQDDVWYPQKLSRLLAELEAQDALLAHSDLELIDATGQLLHGSVWDYEKRQPERLSPQLLLLRNTVTGCTVMIRKSLVPDVLPFPKLPSMGGWYHDHWLALVAAQKGRIVHIREPLVQYRQHASNVVGAEKQAGTIRKELELWLAKKGRLTLKSYPIHRQLSEAFYQRFSSSLESDRTNPFHANRIDFGFSILKLGLQSFLKGYGAQGITLRLLVNKVIFDVIKIKTLLTKKLTGKRIG